MYVKKSSKKLIKKWNNTVNLTINGIEFKYQTDKTNIDITIKNDDLVFDNDYSKIFKKFSHHTNNLRFTDDFFTNDFVNHETNIKYDPSLILVYNFLKINCFNEDDIFEFILEQANCSNSEDKRFELFEKVISNPKKHFVFWKTFKKKFQV